MDDAARVENFRKLYTAVGQMTIRWGGLEMAVDSLAYTFFKRQVPAPTEFPRSIKSKVEYLKRCFKSADLAAFKEDGLALVRRIKTGSEERNWIVHGVVTDVLQFEAAGPLRLQKTKYLPTDLQMERKVTCLRNIDEHSILFQMLTNEVLRLDYAIQNALDNGTGHIGP